MLNFRIYACLKRFVFQFEKHSIREYRMDIFQPWLKAVMSSEVMLVIVRQIVAKKKKMISFTIFLKTDYLLDYEI